MKYALIFVSLLSCSCLRMPSQNYSTRHFGGRYSLVWQDGNFRIFLRYTSDGSVHFDDNIDSSIWFSRKRDLYRMAKVHWGQVIEQRKEMGLIK